MSTCVTNKLYNLTRFHINNSLKYNLITTRNKKYLPVYHKAKISRNRPKESTQHITDNKTDIVADADEVRAEKNSRLKDVLNLKYPLPTSLNNIYNLFHTIDSVNNKSSRNSKNLEADESTDRISDDSNTNDDVREIYLNLFLKVDIRRKSLRDNLLLPFNVKNKKKILVVCENEYIDVMLKNGATYAGLGYLDKIENNWRDFDLIITSFIHMPKLVKLAKILGPLKLMPNAKSGTLCNNLLGGLKKLSSNNSIQYRAEAITPGEYEMIEQIRRIKEPNYSIGVDRGAMSKIKIPISLLSNTREQLTTNIQFFVQHLIGCIDEVNIKERKEIDFVYPPPRNLFASMGISGGDTNDKGN
ncbi:hypothetical protein MACJ_000516 [Theileria orientalis]|uniref:50S ribosomal protein L1 n=1 Tax=Theileria orientalis TaxID=68886 RepID=A0A976M469_THEOR|nr:hypothetical protein MACJ_000516 [Theileria orientalis]